MTGRERNYDTEKELQKKHKRERQRYRDRAREPGFVSGSVFKRVKSGSCLNKGHARFGFGLILTGSGSETISLALNQDPD